MSQDGSPNWSEEQWREDILFRQLRLRCHVVKNLAQSLEHEGDFPTLTPKKLCHLIKHTVDVLDKHLPVTPRDQLGSVNVFLCSMAQHLRFIERSRIVNTPWSMVQATEHFLKEQAGKGSHFIIRPQWAYNYSLTGEFVEAYRTGIAPMEWIQPGVWEKAVGDLTRQRIYCIAFPRIERLNALLHANWGHELGHVIAAQWMCAKFGQMWNDEEPDVSRRIREAIQRNLPPALDEALFKRLIVDQTVSELTNSAMEIARDGLTELICDAIGIHLLGPSALAACLEFSAGLSLDESPLRCGRYPPWRYRLRLMVEACDKDLSEQKVQFGTEEVAYPGETVTPFCQWLDKAKHLTQQTADQHVLQRDTIDNLAVREAYALVEKEWKRIRAEALDMLPDKSKKPYRLCERVKTIEDLVAKLESDIPPNEIGTWPMCTAASLEDIVNAGWVFKAKKLALNSDWDSTRNIEKLHRLVLKAVETSFVRSVFGPRLSESET